MEHHAGVKCHSFDLNQVPPHRSRLGLIAIAILQMHPARSIFFLYTKKTHSNTKRKMGFADLDKDAGLSTLNQFLADKSYVEGFVPSQADLVVYEAVKKQPDAGKYPHAARWFKHITSYSAAEKTA